MENLTTLASNLRLPALSSWFKWWMPGSIIMVVAFGLLLFSIGTEHDNKQFEIGELEWVVITSLFHLPFFGILLLQVIGLVERIGFYWRGRKPETAGKMPQEYPSVCVQLPMFNEHAVARRVIEATAKMSWPRDRFSIQILDDSTDADTRRLVEQICGELWSSGIDCCVLRRGNRYGYKAGALEAGRRQTNSEFLVIFDADFVPPVDFLQRTIPHFYLEDGTPDSDLALVQAQWGHLNHDESALTLSQSLWVDDHHTLQMSWRSAVWKFVNFTGTAGVWRASTIEAVGGWKATSLVEDCELSFRHLFAGYRTKFVKEIVVPSELPATYTAYKAQQKRWTQGWVQLQRMHLRTLLFDYQSSWQRRLHLLYHMCISWQWPIWMLWIIMLSFLIYNSYWFGALDATVGVVLYLVPSIVWLSVSTVLASLETKHTYSQPLTSIGFLKRVSRIFPQIIISTGMLPHQFSAFMEGLFGPLSGEFERTPKSASVTGKLESSYESTKRYAIKIHMPYVLAELFFVVFQLGWAIYFFEIGLIWCGISATFFAACVIYVAFFYGDHLGKVCFVIDRDKPLSLAQTIWRNLLKRKQFYTAMLGVIAFLLVLFSIVGQFSKLMLGHVTALVPLFYVDIEQNVPTYFSVMLILFAAILLAVIAMLTRKQKMPHQSKWLVLSCGFLLMAIDEAFQFHERLNIPIGSLLGNGSLGIFYFPWVIPGIVLVFVLGLYFMRFLFHLPAVTKFRFLLSAILYIGGAIGVELIGSHHAELYGYENWMYTMIVTLEESLEMAGLIVFLSVLLKYCADNYSVGRFQFGAR